MTCPVRFLILSTLFLFQSFSSLSGIKPLNIKSCFVLSIGIDEYARYSLSSAVNDASSISSKIISDNSSSKNKAIDSVYNYLLLNENATIENIEEAFKNIGKKAKPNDYFIFYFGGLSFKDQTGSTSLIPFQKNFSWEEIEKYKVLRISILGKLLKKIKCRDQLIISEACYGTSFGIDLIANLFESDPIIADDIDNNRIILTSKELAFDGFSCSSDSSNIKHGPLTWFILQNENLVKVFSDPSKYEMSLTKTEVHCSFIEEKYFALYSEKDFTEILLKNNQRTSMSRGAISLNSKKLSDTINQKKIAVLIATNIYNSYSNWGDLKNPINDAKTIGGILRKRYGVKTIGLYNKPRDSVLMNLIDIKNSLGEKDQLIVFIAGHGYYSDDFSDGNIVFKNSLSLQEDPLLKSYLQMSTLHKLLDNSICNNIFVLIDICFGASFDLGAKDISPVTYNENKIDISLQNLEERKSKYKTRIFLASGKAEVPDYWSNSLNHSPFADKLIDVLKSENKFITPGRMYTELQGNITEPFLKQFGMHDSKGDFILSTLKKSDQR